jgi:branched-chain amino acid transport system ATP-binding protein
MGPGAASSVEDLRVSTDTQMNGGQTAAGEVAVLELKGLCKSFGGLQATRSVSLRIMPGDRKAIIGPNGAGKTTLFNLITGIYPVTSGQILLFGQDVTTWPSHRRTALGMARTFQVTSLFPGLTVLNNVLLAIKGLRPTKFVMWRFLSSYKDVYDKAHHLLEQVGFLDRKDIQVRNLSHGEQRQLEIAMTLATRPRILLLDEPLAGMGGEESARMVELLQKLKRAHAMLLVEHDMDAVFALADRLTVMVNGSVLESGAPEEIRASAAVQEAYLGTEDAHS